MSKLTRQEIISLEERYQLKTYRKLPIVVERGEGSWIWDEDGTKYLDFYGGHCVTLLGHRHPKVVQAIKEQADTILFYSNLVYSGIRAQAAEKLVKMAPDGLNSAFFCNSGTEANETALKLARKHTGRSRVIAFEGDFHGRTLGSLATTWTESYRKPYAAVLPDTTFVRLNDDEALKDAFEGGEPPAAVIIEPIQSIAGMTEESAHSMDVLRELCDANGTLLIFDEVQTGVGRTGTFSISSQLGVQPDMITLAKSLGSGMPVGAVLTSESIADDVEYGDQGTTFGGGMLAMAAVLATLETIEEENLMPRTRVIQKRITEGVEHNGIRVRGKGCLLGLEFPAPTAAANVIASLRSNRVIVGGSSNPSVLRLMPPATTSKEELEFFFRALKVSLAVAGSKKMQYNA